MQAVTREEYEDAIQILETVGGVVKSASSNKMNEINPHRSWAKRVKQSESIWSNRKRRRLCKTLFVIDLMIDLIGEHEQTEKVV